MPRRMQLRLKPNCRPAHLKAGAQPCWSSSRVDPSSSLMVAACSGGEGGTTALFDGSEAYASVGACCPHHPAAQVRQGTIASQPAGFPAARTSRIALTARCEMRSSTHTQRYAPGKVICEGAAEAGLVG